MRLEDSGIIYDAHERAPSERIAFFTSLCPLRSGTMLAGFQIGSGKHASDATIRLARSRDDGNSWQEIRFPFVTVWQGIPGSLAAGEMVEIAPGRLLLFTTWFDRSDPQRPLFDPETEGILRSRQLCAVSTDDGDNWSSWREVPTPGLTGCATTGPVLQWSDGRIAYALESFKEFDDPRPARHAAWLLESTDGGESFSDPRLVARDPAHTLYYWDQRLCPTAKPGEFVGLFWTHDRAAQRDRPVHFLRAELGHCSAAPRETSLPGQIAAPWLDPAGGLYAFVVDRSEPGTMTLCFSPDGGTTWPEDQRLVIHRHWELARLSQGKENIDFNAYWEDMGKWTFGHPAIRALADRRLLLAYYAGTPDAMSIHWARVRLEERA